MMRITTCGGAVYEVPFGGEPPIYSFRQDGALVVKQTLPSTEIVIPNEPIDWDDDSLFDDGDSSNC